MKLVQSDTWVFHHSVTSDKNLWSKVFVLTQIKPEYSDILYNPTHFPGPLVCRIKQVPLYDIILPWNWKWFTEFKLKKHLAMRPDCDLIFVWKFGHETTSWNIMFNIPVSSLSYCEIWYRVDLILYQNIMTALASAYYFIELYSVLRK